MDQLPQKIDEKTLIFTYTLLLGQGIMSIYQPIRRLVGSIDNHRLTLIISLVGSFILCCCFMFTGYFDFPRLMVISVPLVALIFALITLLKLKKYV